jgi:ABC-type oligopeptide transport system substrate-binding subunit
MFYFGWNADYPDPENFFFLLQSSQSKVSTGGENAANYSNPEFDELFQKMKTMDNSPERLAIIDKMQAILHQDAPWLWGYHPKKYVLQHGWLSNVKPNVLANNKLKYWRIDAAQRERLRHQWNQPIYWPLWSSLILLMLVGFWIGWVLRRRATL